MSQLTDNLSAIAAIKSDIAAAIEDKGVSMSGVSFGSYADKIGEITTSFVTEPLNVTDNGVYNPGQGVDGYSQVTVNVPQSVTGWTEKDLTEGVLISALNNSASYVGQGAWQNNTAIRTVNLPNCTVVRREAFVNDTNLSSISLPVCDTISDNAFLNTGLVSVYLPSCTNISQGTFANCKSLTQVDMPELVSVKGGYTFSSCSRLVSVSLPKLSSTYTYMFYQCSSLTDVYMPNLEFISDHTFTLCTGLLSVSFPELRFVSNDAFLACSSLNYVYAPNLSYVSYGGFNECKALSSITLSNCVWIESNGFARCSNLSGRLELPNCFHVGSNAFNSIPYITEISAPYVVSVFYFAFCNGYATPHLQMSVIDFPNLVHMSAQTFYSVDGITKINLPICPAMPNEYGGQQTWNSSVMNELSFGNKIYFVPSWSTVMSYWVPNILANNGSIYVDAAMYDKWVSANGWSSLSAAFVIEGDPDVPMLSLSDNLLYGKTEAIFNGWYTNTWSGIGVSHSLAKTVSLPECRVVDRNAFNGISIQSVYLPKCNYIGMSGFRDCRSLTAIDLPKCRFIESEALAACYSLSSITLRESIVCWLKSSNAFNYINSYSVYVPASLLDEYKSAMNWSNISSRIFPIPE